MTTKTLQKTLLNSALVTALAFTGTASATLFDSGLPAGWDCVGTCGTTGTDGDVVLLPGSTQYGYVVTTSGSMGVGLGLDEGGTEGTGSTLKSNLFSAQDGDDLNFVFNYISSDGAGFADYAWARLLNDMNEEVAMLFTARTNEDGSVVPGFGMDEPTATLNPSPVVMNPGPPTWSPLGDDDSGACFSAGCGYTGWIESSYSILSAGNYFLEFGVVNWNDNSYQSGLAFDGITVGGAPIDSNPVPVPATLGLLGLGLLGLRFSRRQK